MAQLPNTVPPPRSRGLLAGVGRQIFLLFWLLGLAWLLLVVGFSGYQLGHTPEQTQVHLLRITQSVTPWLPPQEHLPTWVTEIKTQWKTQEIQLPRVRFAMRSPLGSLKLQAGIDQAHALGALVETITHLLWVKARMLYHLLPFFLVALTVGAVDGLVQRDIRKFQAAPDRALFFHAIKRRLTWIWSVPLLLYFVLPWPLSPFVILVPLALGLGLAVQGSLCGFKKYL